MLLDEVRPRLLLVELDDEQPPARPQRRRIDRSIRPGSSKWWYVSQRKTASTERGSRLVESWVPRMVATTAASPRFSAQFGDQLEEGRCDVDGVDLPVRLDLLGEEEREDPVPAPTSATSMPGSSFRAAAIFSRCS